MEKEKEKGSILLIEDDLLISRMYQREFEIFHYKVFLSFDGQEAQKLLAKGEKPDVILLDVMMPTMEGFQFLEAVRKDSRFKDIPVVLLTNSFRDREHIEKGLALGAVDYISKWDFTPRQVVGRVESIHEFHKSIKEDFHWLHKR